MRKNLFTNKKLIIPFFIILILFLLNQYNFSKNNKNIKFVVEHHMTKKITNLKHKLHGINDFNLIFSDGQTSVVQVKGLYKKPPHASATYRIFLEKDRRHCWKVKRLYKIK